jgi:hypothetical protein
VTVKQGKVTATNQQQCLAVEAPAFIAFYHSRADFSGVDVVLLEVKYPAGKSEVQKISVRFGYLRQGNLAGAVARQQWNKIELS